MQNSLKEITYKTIKKIKRQDIVLPSDYSKAFQTHANSLGIKLENENIILKDLHQDENRLNFIVKETNNNLESLGQSAKDAEQAINQKDEKTLRSVQNDIAKMQERLDYLQNELFSDSLTKAKNRKWFCDFYLDNDKFPENGFFVFIDLNDFKHINDEYGHLVGDQVLRYLSEYLKKEIRYEGVHIVRYAGDEFIVMIENTSFDIQTLKDEFKAAQKKLADLKLKSKNISDLKFSFSFGLVAVKKEDEFDEIIKQADEKMYENKAFIKSQV